VAGWRVGGGHLGALGLARVRVPPGWVAAWLPRALPGWAQRSEPADLLAWIIGRGDPPVLAPW